MKIYLITFLLLFTITTHAQKHRHKIGLDEEDRKWSIGIVGGVQYARAYNKQDSIFNNQPRYNLGADATKYGQFEKPFFGGYAGIDMRYYFKNYFFVKAELLYSLQGEHYQKPKDNGGSTQLDGNILRKFHYFKIPVMLGFNANFSSVSFRVMAGLHTSILMAYSEEYSSYMNDIAGYDAATGTITAQSQLNFITLEKNGVSDYYYSHSDVVGPLTKATDLPIYNTSKSNSWPYKRVVWGIDYGIELAFRLTQRIELTLDLRGDYEFIDNENKKAINIYKNGSARLYYSRQPRPATHNLTAGAGLGIHYLFLK